MGNLPCCEKDEPITRKSTTKIKPLLSKTQPETLKPIKITQPLQMIPENDHPNHSPSNKNTQKHGPENYQSLKYLGRGTFGDVVLAQDKQSSKQYAMKIIDKQKIREVNLLQCGAIKQISNCNFLVTIRETFQNENKIYIIMQYLNKGDIYFYLKKKQVKFSEQVIRNLVAQILYGVETLHSYGIIYRQLKPENILVTNDGHIKLTDYGLSKMLVQNKTLTSTFVGALEYMAPQAIKGTYGKQIDIWSLGILIFQLIFDQNPFASSQHSQIAFQSNLQNKNIEQILNRHIGKISQQLRDLLIGLLQKDPQQRLTIPEIKKHAFFKNINWDDVKERKNNPPLKEYIQKNDHIRFRDPTYDSDLPHRPIKFTTAKEQNQSYKANLFEFRNSG